MLYKGQCGNKVFWYRFSLNLFLVFLCGLSELCVKFLKTGVGFTQSAQTRAKEEEKRRGEMNHNFVVTTLELKFRMLGLLHLV